MVRWRALSEGTKRQPATFGSIQNFRVLFLLVLSFWAVIMSVDAHACQAGYKDYYGRCIKATKPSAKLPSFLTDYGQPVNKVGEVADLFAPEVPLFDKPDAGRKVIYSWVHPNADIESEARIEKILPDFFFVTVSVYDGPTSCGMDDVRLKGPQTTLQGYVPKTNPQGVPTLWNFKNMDGLC